MLRRFDVKVRVGGPTNDTMTLNDFKMMIQDSQDISQYKIDVFKLKNRSN